MTRPATRRRRCVFREKTTAVLRPRIAIVGGGFGGLATALKLASLPWTRLTRPEITLVDKSDRFAFLPMMYELATGEVQDWEVAPKFETLLRDTPVSFLQASVESVSVGETSSVQLVQSPGVSLGQSELPFDRAVLALGCQSKSRDNVPGAVEHAMPLYGYNDAIALKEKLSALKSEKGPDKVINVFVIGGSFSGVEAASCIAEKLGSRGSVVLVDRGDRILPRGADFNRLAAERALVERGVAVQYSTDVGSVDVSSISLKPSGEDVTPTSYDADLVIWTAGAEPSGAIASLGVPLDPQNGRIAVNQFLEVTDHEDLLVALGDGASVPATDVNGGYAGTAQVAAQQAEYAAWNTWASLTGRRKLQYRYTQLGEMLVLGARDATVATELGVEVDGTAAWALRRAAYLARMPTDRHRAKLAATWAMTPLVDEVVTGVKASTSSQEQGVGM